jgi:hypothetical protein
MEGKESRETGTTLFVSRAGAWMGIGGLELTGAQERGGDWSIIGDAGVDSLRAFAAVSVREQIAFLSKEGWR